VWCLDAALRRSGTAAHQQQSLDIFRPSKICSGIKLDNRKQAEPAELAQALRPHIEHCIVAGRTSSGAIATDLNARGIAAPNGGR